MNRFVNPMSEEQARAYLEREVYSLTDDLLREKIRRNRRRMVAEMCALAIFLVFCVGIVVVLWMK